MHILFIFCLIRSFGKMAAEQSSHWLDPFATEREKMASTMQIELGQDGVCCL